MSSFVVSLAGACSALLVTSTLGACVGETLPAADATTTTTAAEVRRTVDPTTQRRLDVAAAEIRFLERKAEHDPEGRRETVRAILRQAEEKHGAIRRGLGEPEKRGDGAREGARPDVGASLDELEAMLRSARN
jgi:hypothetical protein